MEHMYVQDLHCMPTHPREASYILSWCSSLHISCCDMYRKLHPARLQQMHYSYTTCLNEFMRVTHKNTLIKLCKGTLGSWHQWPFLLSSSEASHLVALRQLRLPECVTDRAYKCHAAF